MSLFPLLLGLFAVVAIVVLVIGYRLEQKRREKLMLYAVNRGWTMLAEDTSLVERWQGEPFGRGERRRARNVLRGTEGGRPFTAFDYTYETHSNDSKGNRTTTTHRWTVCAIPLPTWIGMVQVVPGNALERLAGAVGLMPDIDMESEDFNRRFRVSASDRKLASDILTPRTMHYLLSVPMSAWRTCGADIVSFAPGKLDPAEVIRTCAVLRQVVDGVPAFVWKDARGDGTG